jgi:hypothetical protein
MRIIHQFQTHPLAYSQTAAVLHSHATLSVAVWLLSIAAALSDLTLGRSVTLCANTEMGSKHV